MNLVLYQHGGSDNRGCEAIVRSSVEILRKSGYSAEISVFSAHPEEDVAVNLDKIVTLYKSPTRQISEIPFVSRALASVINKIFKSEKLYFCFTAKPFYHFNFKDTIAISIGGDHYCYPGGENILALYNQTVKAKGGLSILWGCSIEPAMLQIPSVVKDIETYDLIFARESITYYALKQCGIDNVILHPDPAFVLPHCDTDFSDRITPDTIGINISPYAMGENEIGLKSYRKLIQWILTNSNMSVLLIPHVFKNHSNDISILEKLYGTIEKQDRLSILNRKMNAMELKGVIRKCRFYIGARTHSTIAAYSSCVPTLVLGYSVKAKGIATDLFGSWEHYVVPVQDLRTDMDLLNAFLWVRQKEDKIRHRLKKVMPDYIASTYDMGKDLFDRFV